MRTHHLSLSLVALLAASAAGAAWGQSNEVIDSLLSEQEATLAKTAYLVLAASGAIEDSQTVDQAFTALQGLPWGFAAATPDQVVTFGSCSYLIMRAFEVRGGLMYRLFPGPRYAARELAYRDAYRGRTSPGHVLSGREVADILGRVLDILGRRSEEEAQS